MSQQLTGRQEQIQFDGAGAHNKHQVFVNNNNRLAQQGHKMNFLPHPKPLSHNFFNGKLYAGSKNGSSPSGAARLKRSAKKRSMAKARSSKR